MKFTEINKSITAGATALAGMEGVVAFLNADTTHPWVHLVAVGASAIVGAATWWVKNEKMIDGAVAAIDHDAPAAAAPTPVVIDPTDIPAVVTHAASQAATAAVQAAIPALAPAAQAAVNSVLPDSLEPVANAVEGMAQGAIEAAIEQYKETH